MTLLVTIGFVVVMMSLVAIVLLVSLIMVMMMTLLVVAFLAVFLVMLGSLNRNEFQKQNYIFIRQKLETFSKVGEN